LLQHNIYFVRHGQSLANDQNIAAGSSDSPLTKLGIRQARSEAEIIASKDMKFDTIISSDLSRAYDTAVIIADRIKFDSSKIITSSLLRERSLGTFEGRNLDSFRSASEEQREIAGCEKLSDLFARVERANEFIVSYTHGKTLIVGHSGFYRMARCVAESLPPESTYSLEQPQNSTLLVYPGY
jgi:broad specificity phosphatase PhoE